ncbi:hypothetical protein [Microvirga subterranea]|uniref:PsiF repeat-containing protein n=1 Tax=Microvirga subterranea TaxID=186651 RepID=A0A370HWC4_9HYPH|nr:hypothetical protein [Microvirga subterranea]RDI61254.1 hypothetical protein DES45_102649 [Microvirga subterranea]
MKPAALMLGAMLLALPGVARADEDLVAKRETCREEAKQRITIRGKTKVAVDDYRRLVDRRNAHVSDCMIRTRIAHETSPLPPRKPNS